MGRVVLVVVGDRVLTKPPYIHSVCVVMVSVEVGGRWIDVLIGRQCLQCCFQNMLSSNLVVIRLDSQHITCC